MDGQVFCSLVLIQVRDKNTVTWSVSGFIIAASHGSWPIVGVQGPNVQILTGRTAACFLSESITARKMEPVKGVYK
jgi:hypothetical protein